MSSSPTSNCSSSSSPKLDHNSSLAKLLTAKPIRTYDDEGTETCNPEKTIETITNKRNINQNEVSVNMNRSYSHNNNFNNKTTMQYQHRSSMNANYQVDGNRRRCNNQTRVLTTTNCADLPDTNMIVNGNLQNGHQVLKRGKTLHLD